MTSESILGSADRGLMAACVESTKMRLAPECPEEWGPTCARCGAEEFRLNGYCSDHCEDMHEMECLVARMALVIAGLRKELDRP